MFNFLFLGWIGQKPVEDPYVMCGVLATFYYFFFLLVIVPVLGFLEENLIDYDSLDSAKN